MNDYGNPHKLLLPWEKIDDSVCCRCYYRRSAVWPLARIDRGRLLYTAQVWGNVPTDWMEMTIATSFTLAGAKKKADVWLKKQGYVPLSDEQWEKRKVLL